LRAPAAAPSRRFLAIAFALALLVRLAWALHLPPTIDWFDGRQYSRLALGMLHQHAYLGVTGKPSAFWPPGYPALLAAIDAIAGPSVRAVRIVQCLLDALTVLVVAGIARRVLDARGTKLAVVAVAFYPLYVYASATFFPVTLLALLFASVLLLLLVALERRAAAPAVVAGLLGGWASLTAASSLAAMLVCAAWLAWAARSPSRRAGAGAPALVAAFLLPLAIVVGAWTARNEHAFGVPVLVSTNGGYNFWLGNYPGVTAGTGNGDESPAMRAEAESVWVQPGTEATRDRQLWALGKAHVRADVPRFVTLSASKALHLWSVVTETVTTKRPRLAFESLASWLSYGLLLPFALAWLLASLRRESFAVLALLLAITYTAVHAVVLSKTRFRLPLDTLVIVYGAGGLIAAYDAIRPRRSWPR
jgi:hypothetical protein